VGVPEEEISSARELALKNQSWNPRPLDRDAGEGLIRAAWSGQSPR